MQTNRESSSNYSSQQQKKVEASQLNIEKTALKKTEGTIYTQMTPKQVKKVVLFGEGNQKHLFNVMNDRDVGIQPAYQNVFIESHNDDDRKTTSTQLEKGMIQTMHDLYDTIQKRERIQKFSHTQI